MKKKSLLIAMITIAMFVMSAVMSFAEDGALTLVSSYPTDGQKNTSIENVGVKLDFNNNVDSEEAAAANLQHVRILDEEGKEIPLKVLAKGKEVLVLGDSTSEDYQVASNANYTLVIDAEFRDNDGNTLGKETTIGFKTFNQKVNNYINMGMMIVMFGGIMFATVKQTADSANKDKKEDKEAAKAGKNPYREAKKTGKSVEEIVAKNSAAKEKKNKKADKLAQKEQAMREKLLAKDKSLSPVLPYVYKVKKPRPISAAGYGANGAQETVRQQSKTRQRATGKKK